ncbi:MAG TPA: hypothetical protein VFZ91_02450 [Allosphingosinicella sp.]
MNSAYPSSEKRTPPIRLLAVRAELHVFAGIVYWRQPLRLGLVLQGRAFVRIREQRGDSIGFDARPLEGADLGEGGCVQVHDVTDRLDPRLRGAAIETLRTIGDGEGRTLGLALIRPGDHPFCIWVDDDEFYWGEEPILMAALLRKGVRARIGREI